ncbi:unnamed protein product [Gongylonema pulchrum]|uniref:Uncharacterized protein n=1 Tax=Gongylonema pulchrum TaxID=637853 RepID=A0A3P7QV76_9BILA|nr:unnamed protein product [Gongylonema pulchrum]
MHRGAASRYTVNNLPDNLRMKHLYETDRTSGFLVCRSSIAFHVYSIRLEHPRQQAHVQQQLFSQLIGNGMYWSSARANSTDSMIFMYQHSENRNFHVVQIFADKPAREISLTSPASVLQFCGQPWVHGQYMYLFESASLSSHMEIRCITGRLIRADLHTGQLDIVRTKAVSDAIRTSMPCVQREECDQQQQQQQQEQQQQITSIGGTSGGISRESSMIRRVKHVEREGWLWIIAEFTLFSNIRRRTAETSCEICIMDMRTLTWYRLDWLPKCTFEELTLDVSGCGTVVMLRKNILPAPNQAQIGSFLLLPRNPETLLLRSFRALIMHFPAVRKFDHEKILQCGIPDHLLLPH